VARSRLTDLLQSYSFWVFDASGFQGNPLFTVFDPVLGFSACTLPKISVDIETIQPGNWEYQHKVVKTAKVDAVTLSRGARYWDSDFYLWLTNAIKGIQPIRRNIVIVQFLGYRLIRKLIEGTGEAVGSKSAVDGEVLINTSGIAGVPLDRIPGRAWFCGDCIPTRYNPGDLDANSSDVTIMELDFEPEYVEEMTIATLSPVAGRAYSVGVLTGTMTGL
jgi:phage tail-like protein